MAPTLIGVAGNPRVRRVQVVAALVGVELDYDPTFSDKDYKTPAFLQKFPFGYLPTLQDGDLCLQEVAGIVEYLILIGNDAQLLPREIPELAKVRQWCAMADQELMLRHSILWNILSEDNKAVPFHQDTFDGLYQVLIERLAVIDKQVGGKKWLVGDHLTLADVFVATSAASCFSMLVHEAERTKLPNLVRYVMMVLNLPSIAPFYDGGRPEWSAVMPHP